MRKLPSAGGAFAASRGGFTLVEMLVVLTIILIVSAAALPVVLPALNHRQVNESARLLQGALVGAQDAAVHANAPRGVRFLPDPSLIPDPNVPVAQQSKILAATRVVAIEPAPDYSEGRLTAQDLDLLFAASPTTLTYPRVVYPGDYYPGNPPGNPYIYPFDAGGNISPARVLLVEEAPLDLNGFRNAPTSWFWNIRLGDKIRINGSSQEYTVVGPMTMGPAAGNPELFVNVGPPGTTPPLTRPTDPNPREFLLLVNGQDDNGNGAIDEGWDGIDNDLDSTAAVSAIDTVAEWEAERWLGAEAAAVPIGRLTSVPYAISRRPVPSANARETALPANVIIDLTTWNSTNPERSRLPVDKFTKCIDVMFSPQGDVVPTTAYSTPASFSMNDAFFHFWLAERQDLYEPGTSISDPPPTFPPFLPVTPGLNPNTQISLKGEFRIVTLFTRTGQIVTNDTADFESLTTRYNTVDYNPSLPFIRAQQGVRGGQ